MKVLARRPLGVIITCLAALVGQPCGAQPPLKALDWLNGHWRGPGIALSIDSKRLQANDDPAQPFAWHALGLRNVVGCMLVFDIGQTRYVGFLYANREMHVTSPHFRGERIAMADPGHTLPCPNPPQPVVTLLQAPGSAVTVGPEQPSGIR